MDIAEIIARVKKGESLSQEDRDFLSKYDHQKAIDDIAAAARRKALDEAKAAKARVAELEEKLQGLQDASDKAGLESSDKLAKLEKMVEKLTADYAKANAEKAALVRSQGIADIMSRNAIKAAKGIADKGLLRLFEDAIGDTDLADAEAVKKAVDQFKQDYGGMIAVEGVKVPSSGSPASQFSGANNPFKTGDIDKQAELFAADRQLYDALRAEAGAAKP